LKNLQEVCGHNDKKHPNIIEFYGITQGNRIQSFEEFKAIRTLAKPIDELWNFFMVYFLNTGLLWVVRPQARDIPEFERYWGFGAFIQFLTSLSYDFNTETPYIIP
ncbi:11819_t:CDS:2, partial [Dentiscutata erythropus]